MPYEETLNSPTPELKATYRLLARLRTLAYQGVPSSELAPLLDDTQSLLGLLLTPTSDKVAASHEFCEYLRAIAARHPSLQGLYEQYDVDVASV